MKNLSILKNLLLTGSLIIFAFAGKVNDQEVATYKTIKIGNQKWMAENLSVSNFRNGDPIAEIKTDVEWVKADKEGKPAWCYYNNEIENGKKYVILLM